MQQTINKIKTSQKTPLTRSRSFSPSMRGMSEGQGEFQTTKKAFTLVELIIVITILAVLATIAFVSFSSYTASSRDTKRIVTIESIEK
jgi:prepilin-type N-terminal cleavage/methylation domain-containing protein